VPSTRAAVGALLLALLLTPVAGFGAIVLYDPTLGNRPQDQTWLAYFYDFFSGADPGTTLVPGGVAMDSTGALGDSAGFFNHGVNISLFPPGFSWVMKNPAFPVLNATTGFRLGFELLIRDEDHLSDDRAGFSVILLGNDRRGIELGFWEETVWAQSGPAFTQAESADYDTTAASRLYELTILGELYSLTADGKNVLSGAVRDYTPANPFPDPYDLPNLLFLGDNTGSAGADFTLGRITLATGPFSAAVPAPPAWLLLTGGLLWLAARRRRTLERPRHGPTLG
jgi:hypothetical protein